MSQPINDTCSSGRYGSPCQYDWSDEVIDGGCCVDQTCAVNCLIEDYKYDQSNTIMMTVLLIVILLLFTVFTVKWRRQWEQRMLYAAMMHEERRMIMQSIIQSANQPAHLEMQNLQRVDYEDDQLINQLNQSNNQPIARASSQPITRSTSQSRFEPFSGNSFKLSEMSESHSLDSPDLSRTRSVNQSTNQSTNHSINRSINESSNEDSETLDLDINSESDDEHERRGNTRGPYQAIG